MLNDDIATAELTALGDQAHALRERGACAHMGWQLYVSAEVTPHLRPGQAACLDCPAVFASEAALLAESDDLMNS